MEETPVDKTVANENQAVVETPPPTSSSEPCLSPTKLDQPKQDESLASVSSDNQQRSTDLSRSLEETKGESSQQNSDDKDSNKLSVSSPPIEEKQEQTSHDEPPVPQSSSDKSPENNQTHSSYGQQTPTRSDREGKENQQQEAEAEVAPKEEKSTEVNAFVPASVPKSSSISIDRLTVREFVPDSPHDPTLSILRDLFVRSFDEFYKEIEGQLNLKAEKSLIQWLDETFDDEQEAILLHKYRCLLLCGNENEMSEEIILGFLIFKEEENGSVCIAQVVTRADIERHGYSARLLQHLRNIYPPNKQYWGLCRRDNQPALEFYLKQGATFKENDEIVKKYGNDPAFYAGFEFLDKAPEEDVDVQRAASPPNEEQDKVTEPVPPPKSTSAPVEEEVARETPSTNENSPTQQDDKKKRKGKLACCVLL